MHNSSLSRRRLLGGLAALGGAAVLPQTTAFAAAERHITNPGIHLSSVRNLMAESVPTTLYMLADFGYREVEFDGYFKYSPHDIMSMLSDNGLKAPAAHVSIERIATELDMLIATAIIAGHDYLVMPYLEAPMRETIDQYKGIAKILNIAGEKCKAADIQLCYLNHGFEFQAIDGTVPYDIILRECDADLVKMELDLLSAKKAGADIPALFKTNPGRFPLCHIKDISATGTMADVGKGTMDFARELAAGVDYGGLKHFFVAHDNPVDAAITARDSLAGLNKITY